MPHRYRPRLLAALLLLGGAAPALAQPVRIDTVTSRLVGPGMTYLYLHAPSVPWRIHVLEVDLKNPYLDLEAVKSQDLRAGGSNELTSAMAARKNRPGHRVVGAINAGFFSGGGNVNGLHVGNGEVVGPTSLSGYSSIAFSEANRALVAALTVSGSVLIGPDARPISAYNAARGAGALVLYNRFHGAATGTDATGTELLARSLDPWALNDTVRVVVTQERVGAGNTGIAAGHVVLSGTGAAATFLQTANVGDTLRVVQRTTPALPGLDQAVSGYPILLRNGQKTALPNTDHHNLRHPRTAAGVNADTTKLFLVVVDGRTAASAGQTNHEQQDLMLRLGMANAQGLDGGGSSTMVVNGAVVNLTSDGPGVERAVANALLVYSTAPTGPLARLSVTPINGRVFMRGTLPITVTGADEHYAPVALAPSQVTYAVDPALGTVSPDGLFTAGTRGGAGYLRVRYGPIADSVLVTVKTVRRLALGPDFTVTDTTRRVPFRARTYDDDGLEQTLPAGDVAWHVTDPAVGTVDAAGIFHGRAPGTTQVVAATGGVADTAAVRVEIGAGRRVLDPLDAVGAWRLAPQHLDTTGTRLVGFDDAAATGGRSLRLDYRFTESSASAPVVQLTTDLPVFGVPDTVALGVRSDGAPHRIFLEFVDATGRAFRTSVPRYVDDTLRYAPMPGPFVRANVPYASLVFPVRFTGLRLELAYRGGRVSGKTYAGSLFLDDLRVTYPAVETAVEDAPAVAAPMVFTRSAPNPARDRATVRFTSDRTAHLRITLYDLLGRAHRTVFDGPVRPGPYAFDVDTAALPSGVYVLQGSPPFARPLQIVVRR